MSPELIDPQRFGFKNSRPTKSSDCYALGMVIYETISGHLPFYEYPNLTVFVKVLEGKRPSRQSGFADGLWEMMELCWTPQTAARPRIEDVLQCLEEINSSISSSPR
jgi:serine/threonine protein kinase